MGDDSNGLDDPGRAVARTCLTAGIRAAEPTTVLNSQVGLDGSTFVLAGDRYDLSGYEDIVVLGGGKAAATVAAELESVLGRWIDRGLVVTDNPVDTDRVEVLPGDHPVPSERGVESAQALLELAAEVGPDDLVLCVVTGGGSALLPAPAPGIDLAGLQATTEALLESGASIDEINAVRKHCSALKGGQLAAALAPATVIGLVFSDVVGNRLDVIASGPLTPDESTFDDAIAVLERYDVDVPDAVRTRLERGAAGDTPETPKPGDRAFENVYHYVLADSRTALEGAASAARDEGYEPLILSTRIRGEASEAAKVLVGIAEEVADTSTPVSPPAILLSGGETTVTVRGSGSGGPNQEFVLSGALELTAPPVTVAAVDTDGIDGASAAAGAIATRETAQPPTDARAALRNNDSGRFLEERDALIRTGKTGTNVNDLRAFVVAED